MNLSEIAEELATRLDTIEGLRCYSWPVPTGVPPFAVVLNPDPGDLVYDETYGRGMDRMTLPLVVIAGRASERQAHKDIRAYCDGSGPRSVKAVLEANDDQYESFDTIRVATAGIDGVKYAGGDYLAALFDIDIAGSGS